MRRPFSLRAPVPVAAAFAVAGMIAMVAGPVRAQVFGPPMTIFGSISDSAGAVGADVTVETYVGSTLCGKGKTEFVGDGNARVTVYSADVVSREQTAGCGTTGADVRVKVGDRFATQTRKWEQGPQRLDITFGSATAVPIPTFTPAPTRTPAAGPTRAAGTPLPGASGAAATAATAARGSASNGAQTGDATRTPAGGRKTATTDGGASRNGDDSGGGFPIWAGVVLGLGAIAAVAGGAGMFMSRRRAGSGDVAAPD